MVKRYSLPTTLRQTEVGSPEFPNSPQQSSKPNAGRNTLLRRCLMFSVFALSATKFAGQDGRPAPRSFSLAGRGHITLTSDWSTHFNSMLPPPSTLVASAPHLVFTDFVLLENRAAPAVLEVGVSDNPFLGSDEAHLDIYVRERLIPYLFYYFFPPPHDCLARAKTAFEAAKDREEERAAREADEQEKGKKKSSVARQSVEHSQNCEFSPVPIDFYAAQLYKGVVFQETSEGDRVEGHWRKFYSPPAGQVEVGGKTFFVFEARAERMLDLADVEHFGLPDERRGARPQFFWAIGANTPFPFIRDFTRKELQLIHVVYASLTPDDDARSEFRRLLDGISFERAAQPHE